MNYSTLLRTKLICRNESEKRLGPLLIDSKILNAEWRVLSKTLYSLCQDNSELRFLRDLEAFMRVRHMRQHFVSADLHCRITIDTDIRYWTISDIGLRMTNLFKDYSLIILELKYE